MSDRGSRAFEIVRVGGSTRRDDDDVAIEEPLEIRLSYLHQLERVETTISVTMRTPGSDLDLALGFLWTEGVLRDRRDVLQIKHCGPAARDDGTSNVVKVTLGPAARVDVARLDRHFYTSSSCGVCGKTSLDAVRAASPPSLHRDRPRVDAAVLRGLPAVLRSAQATFARTGGLHAAALFTPRGELVAIREDVGRHNAVDKLVGAELTHGSVPASERVLLVSGRASFELVQKALMAGVPHLVAIGAPSSLAVDLARECGMTLIGFLRDARFNVYSGEERVAIAA